MNNTSTDDDDDVEAQKPDKQHQKPSRAASRPLLRQSSSGEDSQANLKAKSSARALPVFRSLDDFRLENDDDSEISPAVVNLAAPSHSFDFLWSKSPTSYIGDHFRSYDVVQLKGSGELLAKSTTSARAVDDDSSRASETTDDEKTTAAAENAKKDAAFVAGDQQQQPPNEDAAALEKKSTEEPAVSKDVPAEVAAKTSVAAGATELLSTTSRVKEERLWARRMKIEQARREKLPPTASMAVLMPMLMKHRKSQPDDGDGSLFGDAVEQQIHHGDAMVVGAMEDGETALQNIANGARRRYAARRASMRDELERLQMILEEEQALFEEKYEHILTRWVEKDDRRPGAAGECAESLQTLLNEQKAAFNERVGLKMRMIQRIQDTLKAVDEHYQKTVKKHEADVSMAAGKFSTALNNILAYCLQETHYIEESLYSDLDKLRSTCNDEHNAARQKSNVYHASLLDRRMQMRDEFVEELDSLRSDEADKFKTLKQKLSRDVQVIEQQLMLMKAGFQMNAEKLEYNLHVLRRRYEENLIERSKQKRRLTRLQDQLTKVREKARRHHKRTTREIEQYADDCSRLSQQVVELHTKQCHFKHTDAEQYRSVWIVEELGIRKLLYQVVQLDRIISTQILGYPMKQWKIPDVAFLRECGPLEDASSWKPYDFSANNLADDRLLTDDERSRLTAALDALAEEKSMRNYLHENKRRSAHEANPLRYVKPAVIARVLDLLASEASFLLESDALQVLSSRFVSSVVVGDSGLRQFAKAVSVSQPGADTSASSEQRLTVVVFDAVLRALGIGTIDELAALIRYFAVHLSRAVVEHQPSKLQEATTPESVIEASLKNEANHRLVLSGGAMVEQVYGKSKSIRLLLEAMNRTGPNTGDVKSKKPPLAVSKDNGVQLPSSAKAKAPDEEEDPTPRADRENSAHRHRLEHHAKRNAERFDDDKQLFAEFDNNLERLLVPLDDVIHVLQKLTDDYYAAADASSEDSAKLVGRKNHTSGVIQRDSSKDKLYFQQYAQVYDLQHKLQVWSCLYKAMSEHYRDALRRIALAEQARLLVDTNFAALDELAGLMTSAQAVALRMPPLTTIFGDFKKVLPPTMSTKSMLLLEEFNSSQTRGRPKQLRAKPNNANAKRTVKHKH